MATQDSDVGIRISANFDSYLRGASKLVTANRAVERSTEAAKKGFEILGYQVTAYEREGQAILRYYDTLAKKVVGAKQVNEELAAVFQTLTGSSEGLEEGLEALNKRFLESAEAQEETREETESTTSSLDGFKAVVRDVGGTALLVFNKALAITAIAMKAVGTALSPLVKLFKLLISPLKAAARWFSNLANRIIAVASGVLIRDVIFGIMRAFKEMTGEVTGAIATFQTLEIRLDALALRQVKMTHATEDFDTQLKIATKGAQGLLKWVRELSLTAPFDVEVIGNMQALNMAMGFASGDAMRLTEATMAYTAAMGLSSDVMERITYNFGQMKAQGKVTATEMRDLARGSFFPLNDVLDKAAEKLGIAEAGFMEFRKAASEGAIDIDTFFESFVELVEEEFPDALEKMGRTWTGVQTRFKNFMKTVVGLEVLGPIADRVTNRLADLMDTLASPEVIRGARWVGEGLVRAFEAVEPAIDGLVESFKNLFNAITGGLPTVERFSFTILEMGFAFRTLIQFVTYAVNQIADQISQLSLFAAPAEGWGYSITAEFARGMMKGAELIVKVINWIVDLLSGWFAPSSPPKVAPDIDKWGLETLTEWLKGFTTADFSILNAIQDPLREALDIFTDLERITGVEAANIYKGITEAFAEGTFEGGVGEEFFEQLRTAAGEFGDEIVELAKRQLELAESVEAVTEAERALEQARKDQEAASKQVNKLVREYNQQLRAGAGGGTLGALRDQINAQLEAREEAAKRVDASEEELDIAQEQLAIMREMVEVQESLVEQLLEVAKVQLEVLKEDKEGKKIEIPEFEPPDLIGPEDFGLPDLPGLIQGAWQGVRDEIEKTKSAGVGAAKDLEKAFGDISFPEPDSKSFGAAFDEMEKLLRAKYGTLLTELQTEFDAKFGESGSITAIINTWPEKWENITSGIGFLQEILSPIGTTIDSINENIGLIVGTLGLIPSAFTEKLDLGDINLKWFALLTVARLIVGNFLLFDLVLQKVKEEVTNVVAGFGFMVIAADEFLRWKPAETPLEEVLGNIRTRTDELKTSLEGVGETAVETESSIETTMPGIQEGIENAANYSTEAVEGLVSSMGGVEGLEEEMSNAMKAAEQYLPDMFTAFETNMSDSVNEIADASEALGEDSGGLGESLSELSSTTETELGNVASTAETELGNVETSAGDLDTAINDLATNSGEDLGEIETAAEELASTVDTEFGNVSKSIEEASGDSEEAIDELVTAIGEIVGALLSTHDPLADTTIALQIFTADGIDETRKAVIQLTNKVVFLIDWLEKLQDAIGETDLSANSPPPFATDIDMVASSMENLIELTEQLADAFKQITIPKEKTDEMFERLFNIGGGFAGLGGAASKRYVDQVLDPQREAYEDMVDEVAEIDRLTEEYADSQENILDIVDALNEKLATETLTSEEQLKIRREITDWMNKYYEYGFGQQQLEYDRLRLLEKMDDEYADIVKKQEKLAELERKQADLKWLEQQWEFLKMIREEGLDIDKILGDTQLGLDADLEGIIEAMTRAMQELIGNVEDELGIASPSKVFYGIGQDIMSGLATAISDGIMLPTSAMQSAMMTTASVAAAPMAGPTNTVNVNMGGVNINDNMDATTFEAYVTSILNRNLRG